jgi:hypothetical protein
MERGQYFTVNLSKKEVAKIELDRYTAILMKAVESFKNDGWTEEEIMERMDLVTIDQVLLFGEINGHDTHMVEDISLEVFWKDTPKVQKQKTDCCERPFDENNPDPHHPDYIEEIDGRK